ncbi:MAG TPA: ABC transporter permease [Candidatus Limnocylindrales bacterium]|nr:ABC transporter permease [Candidatus Limnocylindrales bacterium]
MSDIVKDGVFAFRQLRTSPGFAVTAVLSLALGIGANTAIFQLVDAIRLRLLPVQNPQSLVMLDFERPARLQGNFSTRNARFTSAQVDALRHDSQAFSGVAAWADNRFNLAAGGEARYAEGAFVSGNFFPLLGVRTMMGRTITEQDDTPACSDPGAVISYSFWEREFNSDPAVLSRTLTLEGRQFPVIGVLPPDFSGIEPGYRYDAFIPICADRMMSDDNVGRIPVRNKYWLSAVARLRPGWTAERARSYLHGISPAVLQATIAPTWRPKMIEVYVKNKIGATDAATGDSSVRGEYGKPLWILMATTGVVLLIACANLANLLLARAGIRQREFAVRLAIGASRGRLIRQLMAESLLLAALGGALGALLAQVLSRGLASYLNTTDDPILLQLTWDWRTIAFTTGLALLTCLVFGLTPAFRATRIAPASVMRGGGRSVTAGKERFSLRRTLVVTQVALSLVLLSGALLFTRSLRALMTTEMGFRPESVLSVEADYSRSHVALDRRLAVNRDLRQRLSALPGVISVAETNIVPISGNVWNSLVAPDDKVPNVFGKTSLFSSVSPGYFRTMGTRLVAGRDFSERDTNTAPKVAIVNEMFVKKIFGGTNPIGHVFRRDTPAGKPEDAYQIVGLVQNTKYRELKEDFDAVAYTCSLQDEDPSPGAVFVLRYGGTMGAMTNQIKSSMAAIDPAMSLVFRSFPAQIADSVQRERLLATLSGAFGILAELLATLGLYGVISYMVGRRQNEIGVRMALGADRGSVVRLVLREALVLLAAGLVIGVAIVLWAGKAAASLLFGLKPTDPLTILMAAALLAAIALAAAYFPARRAAGLEPMLALRDE